MKFNVIAFKLMHMGGRKQV